ncbi:MAG: hypothetical protein AB7I33_15225, partial [Gemmatimonadales bacterium]
MGAFRDTITYSSATQRYTRALRHGVTVEFDQAGRHVTTTNRVGQNTTMVWNGGTGRLDSILIPPAGLSGTRYKVVWDGAGKLDRLEDPAGRVLNATVASGKLTSLQDPDGVSTSFAYSAGQSPYLISSRTNRRGFTTWFVYNNHRLVQARVPTDTAFGLATTTFEPWDLKFIDTSLVYTKVLGPRTVADDAIFWINRWGAPTKIQDPHGAVRTVSRGNAAFPALVTRIVSPNGRIDSLEYNGRGNLVKEWVITSQLGSDSVPTRSVTYAYNSPNTLDSPSRVTDALGRHTDYAYNSWGITTLVTDPSGHKTGFEYQQSGSLKGAVLKVTDSAVTSWKESISGTEVTNLATSLAYDVLGNL